MIVSLSLDTKDLAKTYDEVSDCQFKDGCELIEKLGIRPDNWVLDIGSGTGRLGWYVREIIGEDGRYIGIDPLQERIKIANKKNVYKNVSFYIGIAENLRIIPDNSMDVIFLNWVFQWVLDQQAALQEIVRVLKPGGKIGITVPPKELIGSAGLTCSADRVLARQPYKQSVCIEDSPQKQHSLTTTDFIELLKNSSLKINEIQIRRDQRRFRCAQDIIRYFEASFFGNYLSHVPKNLRDQAKADIQEEYAKFQTTEGLFFDYYLTYAIAEKV